MTFKIADTVQLNSGGPTMVVTSIAENGNCHCIWIDADRKLCSYEFDPRTIKKETDSKEYPAISLAEYIKAVDWLAKNKSDFVFPN